MRKMEIKEGLTVEFKSDKAPLSDGDIVDAVVAFANTEGGDLYLGIEDDGEVTGAHKKRKIRAKLKELRTKSWGEARRSLL